MYVGYEYQHHSQNSHWLKPSWIFLNREREGLDRHDKKKDLSYLLLIFFCFHIPWPSTQLDLSELNSFSPAQKPNMLFQSPVVYLHHTTHRTRKLKSPAAAPCVNTSAHVYRSLHQCDMITLTYETMQKLPWTNQACCQWTKGSFLWHSQICVNIPWCTTLKVGREKLDCSPHCPETANSKVLFLQFGKKRWKKSMSKNLTFHFRVFLVWTNVFMQAYNNFVSWSCILILHKYCDSWLNPGFNYLMVVVALSENTPQHWPCFC